MAKDVATLVAEGVVRGVSVGYVATDFGRPTPEEVEQYGDLRSIVRKWLWLELSVTPMPCNPDAVIQLADQKRISPMTVNMLGVKPKPKHYLVL